MIQYLCGQRMCRGAIQTMSMHVDNAIVFVLYKPFLHAQTRHICMYYSYKDYICIQNMHMSVTYKDMFKRTDHNYVYKHCNVCVRYIHRKDDAYLYDTDNVYVCG